MTKFELENRMYHSEFIEWQDYYCHEPWGCEVEDQRAAMMVSATIGKPISPMELFPRSPSDVDQVREDKDAALAQSMIQAMRRYVTRPTRLESQSA